MQNEKKQIVNSVETSEKEKISATLETPTRVCDKRCKICNSSHLIAIHKLKKAGHTFDRIVEIAQKELKFELSKSSLSRHFANYQKHKEILSAKIINNDLVEEATKQAVHTKQLIGLIDQAFKMIGARINAGTLNFDISDLEKLMKLRYQIMNGQDADENDVMAIFQKASNDYGLNLQQGVLFKPANKVNVNLAEAPDN